MNIYDLVRRFKTKYPTTIAWRLSAHAALAEKALDADEEVRYVFCGQKNCMHRDIMSTNVIVFTNKRIILCHKRIFPGYFITSVNIDNVNDIKTKAGILWGMVIIDSIKEKIILSNIAVDALDNILDNFYMTFKKNRPRFYE